MRAIVRQGVVSSLTLSKILLICSISLVVLSVTLSIYFISTQNSASSATQSHNVAKTKPRAAQATPNVSAAVSSLGRQYMNALLQQHYDVMWSLLHPQVQAMWSNEAAFATYWKTRFQGFTLQGFTLGTPSSLSSWVNPETMVRYDQVDAMPISLQLTPQVPANQVSTL